MTTPPTRYEFRPEREPSLRGGLGQEDLALGQIWSGLLRNRWLILGFAMLGLTAGHIYTMRQTPVYDASPPYESRSGSWTSPRSIRR